MSVRRDIKADKVIPAWPAVGSAAVCHISEFIDLHLKDELADPRSRLLPEAEWPVETPRSKVYASDAEWYAVCKAAAARGMFAECPEEEIFRNQYGDMVLNGAMGVDKPKEQSDGIVLWLLRFISIVTPLNAYSRKLKGDSCLLPQASHLSATVLHDDEFILADAEDLQSSFNLFLLPEKWCGFLTFSQKGKPCRVWRASRRGLLCMY